MSKPEQHGDTWEKDFGKWFREFYDGNNLVVPPSFVKGVLCSEIAKAEQREIIICAAVKALCGKVFRGHRHSDAIHALTVARCKTAFKPELQGFITSRNRFVGRHEAADIQKYAKIPSANPDGYDLSGDLYSEDLY